MPFSDPGTGRIIYDSGRGTEPEKVILGEDCNCGDILGYSSGWKRALATAGSVVQGRLVALADGKSGGEVPASANAVVGGYSGATAGDYVYVDEGTNNGRITQTAPSTSGDANTIIGVALSATKVLFFLNSRADSTA
ncbi:MAG: hypothetical protein HYX84_05070 [Chloroflexi bacterium]|nr:hypothetical protein [Chloroflexota bacterium]